MFRVICFVFLLLASGPVAAGAGETQEEPIRLGVITLSHPLMMYRQFLPFIDFVSQQSGIPVELHLAKDYRSIINGLLDRRIDVAILGAVSYVHVSELSPDIVPLCCLLSPNGTPTDSTIIFTTGNNRSINTLGDLAGKRFAFASRLSTSGYVHPVCFLGEHGLPVSRFARVENLATHEAVVRAVERGEFDAGAVSATTFSRFAPDKLKVLAKTSPHAGFLLVGMKSSGERIYALRDFLLSMDYSSTGVAAQLPRWSTVLRHGFRPVHDADYAKIKELVECARRYDDRDM